jgi:hypothetical protein
MSYGGAQSGVGLSLPISQTKTKKFKLIEDSNFILCKATIHKYLEPWEVDMDKIISAKENIRWRYPTEPKIMIDYSLKLNPEAPGSFFNSYEYDRFDYPIKEYEGLASLLNGLIQ